MLLDTCALLWLASGAKELSPEAREQIRNTPDLHISAITGFEIALKNRAGKLILPAEPKEWMEIILAHHGIDVVSLDLTICMHAARLPSIHRDPCDRFIIATARAYHWPVVTADQRFSDYDIEVIC